MEGYMLCLKVQPGRMTVCKKPLEPDVEPVEGALPGATYEEIDVDTIEQGLKAILKFYKDDPVDDSEDAHMTAAYGDSQPVNVNEKAGY